MPYKYNKFINTIDECLSNGVKNGIFQVSLEGNSLNGRTVIIDNNEVVNFGSCSYLGLEVDERLKQGAIDATNRYGTQYSSSRLFSSCNLYEELEDLFYKIFDNNPAILAATTTLTHLAIIPIVVQDDDLIILDHQVHGSVQLAVQLAKARGTKVEMIKHNRMDMLEDLIKANPNKFNKIWYMADGLYSMYGDYAPLKDISYLLEKYPTFHFYVDDAHGMSWAGKHGNGYVLSQMPLHPKMILSTSLAKGFGTGGGVTVSSDKEMMRKLLTCGSSYTYSGPVQPPMLGASIASAKIHLSNEITELQENLDRKLKLTHNLITQYDLPHVLPSYSPIFYIGLGLPRVGYNMVKRLLSEGFYTNIGIFPGVPVKCCGLRLAVTNGQTDDDIKNVLKAFQYHFPKALEEEGQTVDDIASNFNIPFEQAVQRYPMTSIDSSTGLFNIQHERTIRKIDKKLWDNLFGDIGTFDWEGCKFIEETFCDNPEPENNWNLHYLVIRDKDKKCVLATYFTEMLCKDDMIAPADTSRKIEELRIRDKYYLTSRVVMMGSLLSLGNHLFIDRDHPEWKSAMSEMLRIMNEAKQACRATTMQLRDLDSDDLEISNFLVEEGFIKVDMPDMHTLTDLKWKDDEDFLSRFSSKSRWHFKKLVLDKNDNFTTKILSTKEEKENGSQDEWFKLYSNVKNKAFNINTFTIPRKYFSNIVNHPNWEIVELRLKTEEVTSEEGTLVGMNICYKSSKNNYVLYAVGLDYDFVVSHGSYRQGIYQCMLRAHDLYCNKFILGMDASIEKRRFGATVFPVSAHVQVDDNFNMELIGRIHVGATA
jgi:7-keto-8-aminopelargonate synthetase-like enzyme